MKTRLDSQMEPKMRAATKPRRRFWRDESGSFIIFGLAIFLLMVFAGGLGVDVMRYEAHRTKVQNTLDRAILAAAALDQTLQPDAVVLDYFAKAGLGHLITSEDIDWVATDTERRVEASLDLKMGTTFLRMGNYHSLRFPAAGAAEEAASLSEVSLVLDVSGSMGWDSHSGRSKLYELKRAAKQFVNMMLCNPEGSEEPGFDWTDLPNEADCTVDEDKISINVVPYSEQVLLGETLLTRMNATSEHTESSCVTFQNAEFSTVAVNADPAFEHERLKRTGHFDPHGNRNNNPRDYNAPCLDDDWREVTFLEDDLGDLFDVIEDLRASGNTSIDLGMKWGAALLDESLKRVAEDMIADGEITNAFEDRPFAYDKRGIKKVIVLMTDGENTSQDYLHDAYRSGPSGVYVNNNNGRVSIYDAEDDSYYWPWDGSWNDHAYGDGDTEECGWQGSWWTGWRWVCTTVEGDGATELSFPELWEEFTIAWYEQWNFTGNAASDFGYHQKNTNLNAICTAAKAEDVMVFTIGLEVPDGTQDTIMRNCATFPSYYYDVEGLDIQNAFASIAREISKLRLVN